MFEPFWSNFWAFLAKLLAKLASEAGLEVEFMHVCDHFCARKGEKTLKDIVIRWGNLKILGFKATLVVDMELRKCVQRKVIFF